MREGGETMGRKLVLATATLCASGAVGLGMLAGGAATTKGRAVSCGAPAYAVHTAGSSVAGLELTYAKRRCSPPAVAVSSSAGRRLPPADRNDDTTFIYGSCKPTGPKRDPGGCTTPLEVQSAPSCERNFRRYRTIDGPYPHRSLTVRGAPAASFDNGTIMEIYTGRTTISIFGHRASLVPRAARKVYRLSGRDAPALGTRSGRYVRGFARSVRTARVGAPLARPARSALRPGARC
jgi:hypothetical protein